MRRALLIFGLLMLAAVWLGPLPQLARQAFCAHMIMHMTLLGALLALTPRPLYHRAEGLTGLTPLDDQHLGGVIMLLVGGLSYLLGGLWLTAGLLRGAVLEPGVEI
jgi:cytochrome c oxidase assembly factor CtaG